MTEQSQGESCDRETEVERKKMKEERKLKEKKLKERKLKERKESSKGGLKRDWR